MGLLTTEAVNALDYDEFITRFGHVIEHCPLVVAAAWAERPFSSARDIHAAVVKVIDGFEPEGEWNQYL